MSIAHLHAPLLFESPQRARREIQRHSWPSSIRLPPRRRQKLLQNGAEPVDSRGSIDKFGDGNIQHAKAEGTENSDLAAVAFGWRGAARYIGKSAANKISRAALAFSQM